jgi:hypothetical protein
VAGWPAATSRERAATLPGDGLIPGERGITTMATTIAAPPEAVWPWLVQLGKRRAGWYLPARLERLVPARRRALRHL